MATQLIIRPTEVSDAAHIVALRNDPATLIHLHDIRQYNLAQTENWLRTLPATSQRYSVWLPGGLNAGEEFVGLVRIDRIDHLNANCMVGLDIVPAHRGRKYSHEIYAWLLARLFNDWNIHVVSLEVLETNVVARRLYERLGFQVDGVLRERVFRDGRYVNSIAMSLLRSEYQS